MRTAIIMSGVVIAGVLVSCGSGSPSRGSGNTGSGDGGVAADAGVTGADAGAGQGGGTDAGTTDAGGDQGSGGPGGNGSSDGGSGGGGSGGTSDGGSGGQTASDCDGLLPPAPGAPSQFRWTGRNIGGAGACLIGDVDGTGHIALLWQNQSLGDSHYVFVDGSANSIGGSYSGTGPLELIGQSSGFMGIECSDVFCRQGGAYEVLDPAGAVLYRSASDRIPYTSDRVPPNPSQINDPTGGMIRVRLKDDGSNYLILLDAIDASGGIRWTRQVPETWPDTGIVPVANVGVDRKGNVLVVWGLSSGERKAQWLDHEGSAGPVFITSGFSTLIPRVGDGFFVRSIYGATESVWDGQFEPFATTMSKPPGWLPNVNADTTLHMVHGGRGYAIVPGRGASDNCEQSVSVVSPSGQLCGTATFSLGGGSCYLAPMVVGYDGTAVQQLPRDRENACASPYTSCDCTYRYWPGYFR